MNVKKKARRVMSGLLTAVTVLSTVLLPLLPMLLMMPDL